jgi:hypothetical protein
MSTEPSAQNRPGTTASVSVEIPLHQISVTQAAPAMLSQNTAPGYTGVPKRTFLEQTRDPSFPVPVSRVGKLRLVPTEEYVRWLRAQSVNVKASATPANDLDAAGNPTTAAGVLSELGFAPARGRR